MVMEMLHTALRVGDMERSKRFYMDALGMQVLREADRSEQKYSLCFLGYDRETAYIELIYNYGVDSYDIGGGFAHIAVSCDDVAAACDRMRELGYTILREPGPIKGGETRIAFVQDPDGYRIELIQRSLREILDPDRK